MSSGSLGSRSLAAVMIRAESVRVPELKCAATPHGTTHACAVDTFTHSAQSADRASTADGSACADRVRAAELSVTIRSEDIRRSLSPLVNVPAAQHGLIFELAALGALAHCLLREPRLLLQRGGEAQSHARTRCSGFGDAMLRPQCSRIDSVHETWSTVRSMP